MCPVSRSRLNRTNSLREHRFCPATDRRGILEFRHRAAEEPRQKSQGDLIMSATQTPSLDMDKLNQFVGQFVTDLGATVHAGLVVIGEKLGLYKALATAGPMTSAQLAAKTNTDERYVREWLSSQAAGGYITFDNSTGKFSLTEEQAFTLANEDSPAYLPG